MQRAFAAATLLIVAAALFLRLPQLDNRPMHGDEAVHAAKFRELWERGVYRYDPNEYHGPTLYYAALPTVELNGRRSFAETTESDFRLAAAAAGVLLALSPVLLRDGLGNGAAVLAALLLALSPACVFYSRYYIQEIFLTLFTVAAIGFGWRHAQTGRTVWLVLAAAAAGLMIATKETAVLAFAGALPAWLAARRMRTDGHRSGGESASLPTAGTEQERFTNAQHLAHSSPPSRAFRALLGLGVAVAVACLFLSGFGTNPAGPVDYLRSYLPWLGRAGETSLHRQPWHYYLTMLAWTHRARGPVWSEGLILGLGLAGAAAAFWRSGALLAGADARLARFLAVFTGVLTVLYSAIPYKTPWCALSFLAGFALLGGIGGQAVLAALRPSALRAAGGLALAAGLAHLGWLAWQTSFAYPTDGRNPYAYAQPVPDIVALGRRVEELSRHHPARARMVVKVFSADKYYWPLPWHLRRLENVGYWTSVPEDADAPVVIASPQFDEELTRRLDATHLMTGYFGLRPGVVMMLWVRMDLWEPFIKSRSHAPSSPGE